MHLLLIDDHKMFIDGLATTLNSLQLVNHVTIKNCAKDALEHIEEGHIYHLIMLDLNMPDMNGFQFMDTLVDRGFHFPVVILSGSNDPRDFIKLRDYDISGYISKSSDLNALHKALQSISKGDVVIPTEFSLYFNNDYQSDVSKKIAQQCQLPPRKMEILLCMSNGMTNKDIAEKLFVAKSTIDGHVKEIYKRLEVSNRVECINKSKSIGLI